MGSKTYNLYSTSQDEVIYASDAHTVSHTDTMSIRRTLPKRKVVGNTETMTPLRVNHLFVTDIDGNTCVLSVSTTIPVGVDTEAAKALISSTLTDMNSEIANRSITGDIVRNI